MKHGPNAAKRYRPSKRVERGIKVRYKLGASTEWGTIIGHEAYPGTPEIYLIRNANNGRTHRVRPHHIIPD